MLQATAMFGPVILVLTVTLVIVQPATLMTSLILVALSQ
jgi:hypothetical protein